MQEGDDPKILAGCNVDNVHAVRAVALNVDKNILVVYGSVNDGTAGLFWNIEMAKPFCRDVCVGYSI